MTDADPSQVLDVLRDVLLKHMQEGLPHYQVQSAVYIGKNSQRLISENDIIDAKDIPGGLRLTMRNGAEYDLFLKLSVEQEHE